MFMTFIKLLPTVIPLLKELLFPSKIPRGGTKPTNTLRVTILAIIVIVVLCGIGYDLIRGVYSENMALRIKVTTMENSEANLVKTANDFKDELKETRKENIKLEREVSEANARIAYKEERIADLERRLGIKNPPQ